VQTSSQEDRLGRKLLGIRGRRSKLGLLGAILAATSAIALAFAMSGTANGEAHNISGTEASTLQQLAQNFSSVNGDSSPTSMQAVATTRYEALAVVDPGETVTDPDVDSYAIVVRGNFTALAKMPPGATPPTGDVLWLIVSASDNSILDWGVGNYVPDLSSLGTVVNLG
jgi:hypothetical protein